MDLAYDDIILDNGWSRTFKWFLLLSVIFHASLILFSVVVLPGLTTRTREIPPVYTVNLVSLPPSAPPAPAAPASLPVDTKSKIPPVQEIPAPEPEPAELVPVGPIKPKEPDPVEIKKKETLPPEPEIKKVEPKPKPPEPKPEPKPKPKPKPSADQRMKQALKNVKRQVEAENQDQEINQVLANLAAKSGQGDGESSTMGVRGSGPVSELDARMREYYVVMHNIIKHNWNIPTESMVGGQTDLESIYIIRIAPSGQIIKAWFEKKSGSDHFDTSVEKAIERSKLPPLPDVFGNRNIEVGFRFTPSGMKKK
jgi:colicin import membrane protein